MGTALSLIREQGCFLYCKGLLVLVKAPFLFLCLGFAVIKSPPVSFFRSLTTSGSSVLSARSGKVQRGLPENGYSQKDEVEVIATEDCIKKYLVENYQPDSKGREQLCYILGAEYERQINTVFCYHSQTSTLNVTNSQHTCLSIRSSDKKGQYEKQRLSQEWK